jgi:hypothetical protein
MILARLLSATPTTDGEHWDFTFRRHFDVWNTDVYAQDPAPYQRNPQLEIANRPPYPWMPAVPVWSGADALFPTFPARYGFGTAIDLTTSPPTLNIFGQTPVNAPPVGFAPQCPLEATVLGTGGIIPTGTYLIAIAADVTGPVSTYFIRGVVPPGITTATMAVSGVVWQGAAPAIGVFVGTSSLNMQKVNPTFWTGSSADSYGNPTVFTLTGIASEGLGLPDPVFNSFLFQAKQIVHGGVWGAAANSYGSVGSNLSITFTGAVFTVNQWIGYVISIYSAGAPGISINSTVVSNTVDTIVVNVPAPPPAPPVGTVFVMRAAATSITATTIGDANFVNGYAPTGLAVNAEAGNMIRIMAGTGKGQPPATIVSNTATVLTIATPWTVTPDATSVYIVEAPVWKYSLATSTIYNTTVATSPAALIVASIPTTNLESNSLLIEGLTIDVNGNWSVERYAPLREVYIPASVLTGGLVNPGYFTITPGLDGVAAIDLTNGLKQQLVLPTTTLNGAIIVGATSLAVNTTVVDNTACPFTFYWNDGTGEAGTCSAISGSTWAVGAATNAHADTSPICTPLTMGIPSGSVAAGGSLNLYLDQPSVGSCPVSAFATGTGGWASDTQARVAALPFSGNPTTRTTVIASYHGSIWAMDSGSSGASTS